MHYRLLFCGALLCGAGAAFAAQSPSERFGLAAPPAHVALEAAGVDRAHELAADVGAPKSRPRRYAVSRTFTERDAARGAGEWRDLPNGDALWRLPVHAAGALTLDFGFRQLWLPPGAALYVSNAQARLGPYTDADNTRSGEFWTPLLRGEDALLEVELPRALKPYLKLDLGTVHVGFRDVFADASSAKSFYDPNQGSGSCNIDTICPDGDPWRKEINAEAILVFNGGFCSGQLMEDATHDHTPYLSTANHCISTPSDAAGLVVYWKYESPVCRAPFSSASAQPVPTDNAIPQTGGAVLRATYQPADFTLVQLNTPPPAAAQAYWNGWDRTENAFGGAAVMHHPSADSKRISFPAGTVTVEDDNGLAGLPGLNHWFVDHYASGTTEEGSSGSGLLDGNHRLRGVLSGGDALCTDLAGADYYGRLSTAWDGGGTPDSRVRDWLDPHGSGVNTIDGSSSTSGLNVAIGATAAVITAGQQVTFTATAGGGTAPYTYAFDLDGDGAPDNLDTHAASLVASYPHAFSGNVSVRVTDAAGHSGGASMALIVQAQDLAAQPLTPVALCGNGDGKLDPGERWSVPVTLFNLGKAPTQNGYAVFAQDLSQPGQAGATLENPAIALPAIAPGGSAQVTLNVALSSGSACGAPLTIRYLGSADDRGFTADPNVVLQATLGNGGSCAAVTTCAAQITPIVPKRGNFFDPTRSGSGVTQVVTPIAGSDPVFFGAWFTGDSAREPTWYVVNDLLHGNQVNTTLYLPHLNAPNQFPEVGIAVGTAQVSVVSATKFIYTWTLNGVPGGGVYVPVIADANNTLRAWYNTGESGWGTFDELFPSAGSNGHPFLFGLDFLYDAAGNARWTTASDASYVDGHVLSESAGRPSCPGCVWLDFTLGAQSVGTQSYGNAGGSQTISTNLTFPAAFPGTWLRTNLPVVPLAPPQ